MSVTSVLRGAGRYVEYDGSGLRDIVIEHVKRDARAVIIGSGCSCDPPSLESFVRLIRRSVREEIPDCRK